jgi:hypothetical protein
VARIIVYGFKINVQMSFPVKWINGIYLSQFNKRGSEKWTLTASQRRRIEAAEMKLILRPLAGYALYDYKTNDSIRREQQTDCILDKIV